MILQNGVLSMMSQNGVPSVVSQNINFCFMSKKKVPSEMSQCHIHNLIILELSTLTFTKQNAKNLN